MIGAAPEDGESAMFEQAEDGEIVMFEEAAE